MLAWGSVRLLSLAGAVALALPGLVHAAPSRGKKVEGRLEFAARGTTLARVARGRASGERTLPILVQATDAAGVAASLRALGGRVGVTAGDVITASVPRVVIASLAADPRVVRVELARRLRPKLDRVRTVLGVNAIHDGTAPSTYPYTGRSVLIGDVDLTLDLTHPAFRKGQDTRVVALWDQDGATNPPAGFGYGTECRSTNINRGRCGHEPLLDHGTAVLAIAGGSRYSGTPFYGIAPGADLAFVSLGGLTESDDFNLWFTTALCDGVSYLFSIAEERGEPAVVNLSVGTHAGPHDGSSLGDRCLDNLVGPGRIVVAAAGNEGSPSFHYASETEKVWVHASGTTAANPGRLAFVAGEDLVLGDQVQVWFEEAYPSASIRVGVLGPSGAETVSVPVLVTDDITEVGLDIDGRELGAVFVVPDQAPSGDRSFEIVVFDDDGDTAENQVTWFVELADTGVFDAYLDVNSGGGFVAHDQAPGFTVDSAKSVGFPATAAGVIAVGSSVSRFAWENVDGDRYETFDLVTGEPLALGELSSFSSRGPTRDPERTGPKPEFVAPGEMVVSALPRDLVADTPIEAIVTSRPAYYSVGAGTSEAAPAAAGVIALMLERDPSLDPEGVRAILRETSELPAGVSAPSDDWGFGQIRADAALAATTEVNPGEPPSGDDDPNGCGCTTAGRGRDAGIPGMVLALGIVGLALGLRRRPPRT
ncbi:MAG: S8 family serine peptidase [Polyangiaceae bacterium]|nr:S8 family serine peptidase [Polyangiaceae bacterium]